MAGDLHEAIRARLLAQAGVPPDAPKTNGRAWSWEFEQLMRNRLRVGGFRYGALVEGARSEYDRIGSAISRLRTYRRTGNLEHLVDAANMCLVEFVMPSHPAPTWDPADDGEHAEKLK